MTLREALRKTAERLELHRVSNPRLNAEVIVAHSLGVEKTYLYTHDDRVVSEEHCQKIEDAVDLRVSGVPVQYIVGKQEFYGRYFTVNPHVLIPRPETEHVIEAVLDLHPPPGTTVLDIGTGSGCIGLTLALELPDACVFIADVSLEALRVAQFNATELGARTSIACMDLLDAASGPIDIIVSNPPYVSPAEASKLQIEVREHEPHVALFAPEDGLAMFRRLIPSAERVLKPGGYLIMEIGQGLEQRVLELFGARWEVLPTRNDLQGIPRTVSARLN